jgi:hypothetical protein
MELHKAGWFTGRSIVVSTALANSYRATGLMYEARRLDPARAMLAMNFLMDRSAENWATMFERIYEDVGACRTDAPITATGALSGSFRWSCDKGAVAGSLLLAPTNPPTNPVAEWPPSAVELSTQPCDTRRCSLLDLPRLIRRAGHRRALLGHACLHRVGDAGVGAAAWSSIASISWPLVCGEDHVEA